MSPGQLALLLPKLAARDEAEEGLRPSGLAIDQATVEAVLDGLLEGSGPRGDGRDPQDSRLEVLQLALGLAEGVARLQGCEVDVEAGQLTGQLVVGDQGATLDSRAVGSDQ